MSVSIAVVVAADHGFAPEPGTEQRASQAVGSDTRKWGAPFAGSGKRVPWVVRSQPRDVPKALMRSTRGFVESVSFFDSLNDDARRGAVSTDWAGESAGERLLSGLGRSWRTRFLTLPRRRRGLRRVTRSRSSTSRPEVVRPPRGSGRPPWVTSVAFGGPDASDMYIVTADHLDEPDRRGCVFRCQPGVSGLVTPLAAI